MNKQKFKQLVKNYYDGVIKQEELYELIYSYCIDKGKDESMSKAFVNFITSFNTMPNIIMDKVMNTIINDWSVKHEIIEVYKVLPNGRTKLITIY